MHTPGPWTATPSGLITAGPRGLHIAQAATTGMGHAADANARLLAAAPEMLAALQWFATELADDSAIDMAKLINEMERKTRAAITKATKGA